MKKALIIVLGILVLAAIVVLVRKPAHQVVSTEQSSATPAPAAAADDSLPVATQATTPTNDAMTPPAASPKLAYAEAVKRYGAQRIQFNAQCQATPPSNIYKVGLELMLDNRAGVERSIVFSGKTYRIAAYDYAVVKLVTPGITYIDCGSSQNVAKITIEK